MNTREKLAAIRAKCVELLAIAEKRTPGEWQKAKTCVGIPAVMESCQAVALMGIRRDGDDFDLLNHAANADFIAACAGPAEAGWRSTIATIDVILNRGGMPVPQSDLGIIVQDILAAWEGGAQ